MNIDKKSKTKCNYSIQLCIIVIEEIRRRENMKIQL